MEDFIKEFSRLRCNPIYFIEKYYNVINQSKLELTEEQKQKLFDKYKMIPLFEDFESINKYNDRIDELKKQGYKDWEIH
ncbi:hypothetical protein [Flavobacterium sp. T12S277]|uniref:hypothetical protein n=1 Tax=Flavobacterium sp. T12S277 TaxID=3402752 RepID=UPI003AEE1391